MRLVRYIVVLLKGEKSVNKAVEERMCIVALRMKCVFFPSLGGASSPLSGSSVDMCGAGTVMGNWERRWPRAGCEGMVPLWACIVREVLKPGVLLDM